MFSKAEQSVVDQLITGKSNKEIANILFVCEKTIKFHIYNIFKKTNVKSRSEFIAKNYGLQTNGGDMTRDVQVLPNQQDKRNTGQLQKTQEDKIEFIDSKFNVGKTIGQLHNMMIEVTKEEITPSTVNAACNCVTRLNETINTAIQAARFLNER